MTCRRASCLEPVFTAGGCWTGERFCNRSRPIFQIAPNVERGKRPAWIAFGGCKYRLLKRKGCHYGSTRHRRL
ncbi:hypothetical protein DXC40_06615 [Anaerotruncus colihominis]|uniref:Uncharacterized protein n=1 Tax=Anaerotruncus colihominis TaxID=169435 RepID=A0A3E3IPF4_9FIRM|nr:hypothetical protein DXC40_06615 [Anaerotruncus colihominis]